MTIGLQQQDVADTGLERLHGFTDQQIEQLVQVHGGVQGQAHFIQRREAFNGLFQAGVFVLQVDGQIGDLEVGLFDLLDPLLQGDVQVLDFFQTLFQGQVHRADFGGVGQLFLGDGQLALIFDGGVDKGAQPFDHAVEFAGQGGHFIRAADIGQGLIEIAFFHSDHGVDQLMQGAIDVKHDEAGQGDDQDGQHQGRGEDRRFPAIGLEHLQFGIIQVQIEHPEDRLLRVMAALAALFVGDGDNGGKVILVMHGAGEKLSTAAVGDQIHRTHQVAGFFRVGGNQDATAFVKNVESRDGRFAFDFFQRGLNLFTAANRHFAGDAVENGLAQQLTVFQRHTFEHGRLGLQIVPGRQHHCDPHDGDGQGQYFNLERIH